MDGSSTNSTIINNIVLDSAQNGVFVFDATRFPFFAVNAISNNLYWGNAMNGMLGALPVLANPRLVTVPTSITGAAKFTLSPGSPAIGAGVPIGFLRPNGGPTDIGAYQTNVPPWHAGVGF